MAKIENSQHPEHSLLKDEYKPNRWLALSVAGGLLAVQILLLIYVSPILVELWEASEAKAG